MKNGKGHRRPSNLVRQITEVVMVKVGKKGAICLPERVMERLGVREDDKALLRLEGDELVLKFVPDPLALALRIKEVG